MSTRRYTWTDDGAGPSEGLRIDGVPFDLVPCMAATLAIRQLLGDAAERDARIKGLESQTLRKIGMFIDMRLRAERAEAELARAVEAAYREGWTCGTDDDTGWQNSESRKRLEGGR